MSDEHELINPDDIPTLDHVDVDGMREASELIQEMSELYQETGNPDAGLLMADAQRN